ncbi:hypothetical protein [Acidipila sp. EB88]|uniref:hypothetical protein n=1 Tax=Acidipila sp. EB88 TaxID=2305226 RepID=UPI000F5EE717|nr:hypothetical protein [Acidipila sp. EB88]RRA48762.1 hypothetical protein D1Y84_11175 [Acidipila sp. EB88]
MKNSRFAHATVPLAFAALLLAGCSKQAPQQATQSNPQQYPQQGQPAQVAPNAPAQQAINPGNSAATTQAMPPAPPPETGSAASGPAAPVASAPPQPVSYTIPAGTRIVVTTHETIDTKTAQPGQSFSATVALPITVRGATLVRSGSEASGTVIDSKSPGRFKGAGTLAIRLDSLRIGGRSYPVSTSAYVQSVKGKGKRTAVMAGGGTGVGALIGGLAGGGKGALIGGLVGAGGGTAGAAFTGNKDLDIPAESRVSFSLRRSITVSR